MTLETLRKLAGVELVAISATEKTVAMIGGGLSIFLLATISHWAIPGSGAVNVVASMAASAVLLFAVPHGQLSQPWPVIAGHTLSALIGVACARHVADPVLAAACAVGLAVVAMQQCKCIHPPGGATAYTAVMGGTAIRALGFDYVLVPVMMNAVVMVSIAVLFNSGFSWRRYPAALVRRDRPQPGTGSVGPTHDDVVAAIRSIDSFVDVSEDDLLRLTEALGARRTAGGSGKPPGRVSKSASGVSKSASGVNKSASGLRKTTGGLRKTAGGWRKSAG